MFGIEEVIDELNGEEADNAKERHRLLPPGFRFHPTDEELIAFYLASKVFKPSNFHGVNIAEVDLNRCEPWELPGTRNFFTIFSLGIHSRIESIMSCKLTLLK